MSQVDTPSSEAHLEPAEFEFREGESVRVDLVAGDTRVPMIIQMKTGGQLEMALIDPDQAWFWTEQWQAGEREADEDIAAGRGETYENTDEFLDSFDT